MAVAGISFNGIVPELLTSDNYERWSVLMKNYLMGHGLWGIVLSNPNKNNEKWQKKNAMALYAIQLSCGPHAFYHVQWSDTAKVAWNQLSLLFSKSEADLDIELGILDDDVFVEDGKELHDISDKNFWAEVDKLYQNLISGEWEAAKSCIDKGPHIPFFLDSSGKTILHIAAMTEQEAIVEKLIDLVEEKENLLKKKDRFGYTALDLAASLTDNIRMAKCMVEKCQDLLTMEKEFVEIPVLLASATNT
ncbi:hypothetical protein L6164_028840 [Bauhinia variegata]|uniref:Uncharacterized protein n=1 Tax=Bauhinia variegata TaxID=167791 RepID=A0ACB9L7D4_BAUVA|nr:hypothetical protein L6164_028840 [Bauhinia variegata]